jgi:hypothetical protein
MADYLALQIFPNLFLGETREISALQAKKFGSFTFPILRPAFSPGPPDWRLSKNKNSTISYFPKQIVDSAKTNAPRLLLDAEPVGAPCLEREPSGSPLQRT